MNSIEYKFKTTDHQEAMRIMKSEDMASVLFNIEQLPRKYKYEELGETEEKMIQKIFSDIREIFDEHSIIIHELID